MITETATFELASPADLSDASSPTTSIIHAFLTAILNTKNSGAHAAFFGQSLEKPDTIILSIDWDSTEAHNQFAASSVYELILSPVKKLMNPTPTTPLQILHVPPIPHTLFGSQSEGINIAEIVFFYFPASLTPEATADITAKMGKLRSVLERSEAKGVFEGWAEEGNVVYTNSKGEEGKCKVWVNVVGWEDVAAHERVVESEEFGVNKEVVMGIEGLRGVEMFHTRLVRV